MSKLSLRILVFITALLQFMGPVFTRLLGQNFDDPKSSPKIIPAGYTFAIWGVITFLAIAYGIYQLFGKSLNKTLHEKISIPLSLVYISFNLWLLASAKNWLMVTVIIFVFMFLLLTVVFKEILKQKQKLNKIENVILLSQIAIYTGWCTVAIFANTAAAMNFYGCSPDGTFGTVWQSLILLAALCNSLYFIFEFNRSKVYIVTILWAFVGVFFGLLANTEIAVLAILTISAIIIVLIFGFLPENKLPLFYRKAL